jgi:succinate dehydrogenase / fumarate reductase cytochrome b subunit
MAEAAPRVRERPISPYVSVWRWHITMATSILHRVTGVGLYGGALILAGWAVALASGREAYDTYMGLLGSIPGRVVMFGLTVCVFYHLANGLRHLAWDMGKGYDTKTADLTAVVAITFGFVAAVAVWIVAALGGVL